MTTPITLRFCASTEHDKAHSLQFRSAKAPFPPTSNLKQSCHFSESARSLMNFQQIGFKELESMSIFSITAVYTPKEWQNET